MAETNPSMSLRLRVLTAIAAVLLLGAAVGTGFGLWDMRRALREELTAAMVGGRQTVASAFEDLPRSDHRDRDLRQLIGTFNGNRHVRAALIDPRRTRIASVAYHGATAAPDWFVAVLDPHAPRVRITAPGAANGAPAAPAVVELSPVAAYDIGDAWRLAIHAALVLALACAAGFALVYVTIGQALRPLSDLYEALARVGGGDYGARVGIRGPTELARLARGFNTMAGELSAMRRRTRLLEAQVLKLQDEERAELARDLHDEIGPHLFAANIDATMLGQAIGAGQTEQALGHVKSIQTAVARMQRQVRDILGRLRPARLTELGFGAAIEDLVEFWRARRGDVTFIVELAVDESSLSETLQEVAYRVVQEGLSNAVRHGKPSRIAIAVGLDGGRLRVRVTDDGAAREVVDGRPRFGLVGMRERIEAVGGAMSVEKGEPRGWTITAWAPLQGVEETP